MNKRSYEQRYAVVEDTCSVSAVDTATVDRVGARLPEDIAVRRTSDIFSALSDPTRLRILMALSIEELCVCEIATLARVSQSAASHQLRLLRDRDLVAFRRDGKRAVYRLADDHVGGLLAQGVAHADERR